MEFINPLKAKYPIVIRFTALIGIGLIIVNFLLFPRFGNNLEFEDIDQVIIENIDIPQTQQIDNTRHRLQGLLYQCLLMMRILLMILRWMS